MRNGWLSCPNFKETGGEGGEGGGGAAATRSFARMRCARDLGPRKGRVRWALMAPCDPRPGRDPAEIVCGLVGSYRTELEHGQGNVPALAVLPMMASAATKRSLLNMVLWRWWPMGGMLVVRLRRRMEKKV